MATASLAAARALLYDALAPLDSNDLVTKVYDHEPPIGDLAKPAAVTMFATGVDPNFWLFVIHIYHGLGVSAEAAQKNVDELILAVEVAVESPGVANIGPSQWTIEYIAEIDAIVATSNVQIGREDF